MFQQIVEQKKEKFEDEEFGSDFNSSKGDENSQKSNGRFSSSSSDSSSDMEHDDLDEREREDRENILIGSFEEILRKLENKGKEHKDIEKYKDMRNWRQKRDKNVRDQLEQFTYEQKDDSGKIKKTKSIIDSS